MASKSSQYGLGGILASPETYGYSADPNFSGVDAGVVDKFGRLQNAFGQKLSVNSGYRSPSKNAKVGGAKRSQHMKGMALDISTKGMTRNQVRDLISKASSLGYSGIGVYGNAVHVDTGPTRAWGANYKSNSVPGWAKETISQHLAGVFAKNPTQIAAAKPQQSMPIERVATPTQNPRTMTAAVTPVERSPLAPVSGFKPGGVLSPPDVSFSPVSSAVAAPSPGAMMSPKAQAFSAPNASRFGPVTQNASYSALGPALSAQAQSLSAPSPDRFGPTTPNATRTQLASALTAQAQLNAAPQASFSPAPASYQSPAFSTAAPKIDAFGQAPHPGLMPAQPSQYTQAPTTAARAPTISAPQQQKQPQTQASTPTVAIDAPQANPAPDQFPDRPKQPGLLGSIFAKPSVPSVVGSLIGSAALGPVGGVLGGLLGRAVSTGGLLGGYTGPVNSIGSGLAAVNSVMSGAPTGTQATTSNGQTVTSVPGGIARQSSKYGWTEITDPKTGMTSFNKSGGGGGIRSGAVRDAMDKASKAGKSGVGSSGGLY